jgi:chromosome partitioning protein
MCNIVAIANQKGGVGKTTLTLHLAAGAVEAGKRVVVVDADPQGNLTSWLLDGDISAAGMFDLLVNNASLGKVIRPLKRWNMGLLPGNYRTGEAMIFLGAVGRLKQIVTALSPLRNVADYVLIDMPPSRSAGFDELLETADWVVIPTQLERAALEGVQLMAQALLGMDDTNLMGVVPNMIRIRTNEHQAQLDDLITTLGQAVWPAVPLSIKVTEAFSYGDTLFNLYPNESVTEAMRQVVDRFLNAEVGRG